MSIDNLPESVNILLNLSHIPEETFGYMRLSSFDKKVGTENGVAAIADLLAGKISRPIVLLYGIPGLGKTHLALSLAWERLMMRKTVTYWQVSMLLDALREGYRIEERLRPGEQSLDTYSAIMNYAKGCYTLILDDMGTQKDTEFAADRLNLIVDHRYIHRKETVITANTLNIPDRILDRCKDGRVVMLQGKSYRGSK